MNDLFNKLTNLNNTINYFFINAFLNKYLKKKYVF